MAKAAFSQLVDDGESGRAELANSAEGLTARLRTHPGNENIHASLRRGVRLQRPYIDIEKCIGCGVCEHECPVSGKKAVRVSAEGETRSTDRTLLLKS
ncbi:MAG: 4Fe-4S binding protein [Gemmatimonadota bacterium]|nr:MAG: 4Fe-4S binding protein [Gemmatimonadota bacterium]